MGEEEKKEDTGVKEEKEVKPDIEPQPTAEGKTEEDKKTKKEETPNVNEIQIEPLVIILQGPKGIMVKYQTGLPVHTARGILKEADSMLEINTLVNNMKAIFNPRIAKPGFRGIKH